LTQEEIANKYRINQSLVSKWIKIKAKTMAAAVDAHKKMLKIRKGSKHKQLHSILFTKFKEARSKGYCVDFRGTQREYNSKLLKHGIVKRILVFKR